MLPRRHATTLFRDRVHAGVKLAEMLQHHAARTDVVVLGLPRGGVPVAAEVARRLGTPLDIFLVRKLGAPSRPELAVGALAADGVRVIHDELVQRLGITPEELAEVVRRESAELARRTRAYGAGPVAVDLREKTVIVVDDGLATGATMRAAVEALRLKGVSRVVVAAPVAAPEAVRRLREVADEVVVVEAPPNFRGVGAWYEDFTQTSDEEVQRLLAAGRASRPQPHARPQPMPPPPPESGWGGTT
ncbi:MAG: phosphoribosyltransferase family protein, partial [Myxococcota bacterium]